MSSRAVARIAGLVLAAGSSERMGADNKMLLPLGSETLLRRAVRRAVAAGLDPVIVVTGHQPERSAAALADSGCVTVFNADHAVGIHTSVRAGIEALEADAAYADVAAVVIVLPDMPFVTADMLRRLADRYRSGAAPLVISRYGGEVPAPPMLYERALFAELKIMQRRCGREVVQRHRDAADVMEWPRQALADVDTPDDYARIRATIESGTDDAAASTAPPPGPADES